MAYPKKTKDKIDCSARVSLEAVQLRPFAEAPFSPFTPLILRSLEMKIERPVMFSDNAIPF